MKKVELTMWGKAGLVAAAIGLVMPSGLGFAAGEAVLGGQGGGKAVPTKPAGGEQPSSSSAKAGTYMEEKIKQLMMGGPLTPPTPPAPKPETVQTPEQKAFEARVAENEKINPAADLAPKPKNNTPKSSVVKPPIASPPSAKAPNLLPKVLGPAQIPPGTQIPKQGQGNPMPSEQPKNPVPVSQPAIDGGGRIIEDILKRYNTPPTSEEVKSGSVVTEEVRKSETVQAPSTESLKEGSGIGPKPVDKSEYWGGPANRDKEGKIIT